MNKTAVLIISTVGCLIALCILQPLTLAGKWFPFVYWFNAATVISWGVALYFAMENKWTLTKCIVCMSLVFIWACPQALFCVLVYSSWFCTGISALILVLLGVKTYKLKQEKREVHQECKSYEAIARVYDRLNADIDYNKWADFFESCFEKYLPQKPQIVLDLACGTGRMTRTLAARGYDMIGVDGSQDMLQEAMYSNDSQGILYLLQDMRSFELYGTVGAVVCCLDSINYLTEQGDIEKTFATVHNYLDPDGLFIFDVNTPYKFENIYSDNAYVLEDEDDSGRAVYCGWQNQYDTKSGICDFYLTLFEERADGSYERSDEHQRERCYTLEQIKSALASANMEFIDAVSDFDMTEACESDERWYIVARAQK